MSSIHHQIPQYFTKIEQRENQIHIFEHTKPSYFALCGHEDYQVEKDNDDRHFNREALDNSLIQHKKYGIKICISCLHLYDKELFNKLT